MCAWLLALFCLFDIAPSPDLAVYLSADPNQPAAPVEHMKRELSAMMQAAGYRVVWGDPRSPDRIGHAHLVVLELRGSCGLPPGNYRIERSVESGASLAATAVSPSGVLPFSWVNCANLTRMLAPVLAGESPAQRDYLYGRAMARVAAHELYHAVTGSRDHGQEGVAKPSFRVADLLDESFDFDQTARASLRQRAADTEPPVGR
jgi:hypothetical protein